MFYVTMTDTFMSGWGCAKDKINKLVLECETREEAQIVADNARKRGEMKCVNICSKRPYYNPKRYHVSWHDKNEYKRWYEINAFKGG